MFRLDGVIQSIHAMQSHSWVNREGYGSLTISKDEYDGYIRPEPKDFLNSELLGRLSIVQIGVIAVDTLVTQSLRGAIYLVGGVLTLNWRLIRESLRDFLSLAVQAIALPLIGLISILSPQKATSLALKIVQNLHNTSKWTYANRFAIMIMGILFGLVSIPLSSIRSALRVPIELLDLEISRVLFAIFCVVKEPLASIKRLFTASYYEKVREYEPTAFSSHLIQKALWYLPKLNQY